MNSRKLSTALLALAGTTLLSTAVHAQYYTDGGTSNAAPFNDLILSFQEAGVSTDLQVDLGNISQFTGATPTFVPINLSADLTTVFGNYAASASTIYFSVAGTTGSSATGGYYASTLFLSDPTSTPFSAGNGSTQGSPTGYVALLYSPDGDSSYPATSGANPTLANSAIVSTSSDNSFYKASVGGSSTFDSGDTTETNLNGVLYLDTLATAASKYSTGTSTIDASGDVFSLNLATGELTFAPEVTGVVPEPSTYALIFLGGLVLVWQMARRKSVSL